METCQVLTRPGVFQPNLNALPTEIIDLICEYLWYVHPNSLIALALTSRRCYGPSVRSFYREFVVEAITFENSRFDASMLRFCRTWRLIFRELENRGDSYERLLAAWEPIVEFIARFQHLTDFIYANTSQLPTNLLYALQRHHPKCRLHVRKRMWALYCPPTDVYELELAKSPCLHSLTVHLLYVGSHRHNDVALRVVNSLAPNLKHVELTFHTFHSKRSRKVFLRDWEDAMQNPKTSKLRELETLIISEVKLNRESLETWSQHVDFSKLKSFAFQPSDNGVIYFASKYQFPSLKELYINELVSYSPELCAFLAELPPLSCLSIGQRKRGSVEQVLGVILEKHGSHLRTLIIDISKTCQSEIIAQIGAKCPLLERLDILFTRSQSSYHERRLYEAFGSIRRLEKLSLTLSNQFDFKESPKIPDPRDESGEYAEFDKQPFPDEPRICNGHVRDLVLNVAVDRNLILSIWTIIRSKQSRRSLRYLRIINYFGGVYEDPEYNLDGVEGQPLTLTLDLTHMTRSCVLKSTSPTGNRVEFSELPKSRLEIGAEQSIVPGTGERGLRKIFRRLWPMEKGCVNWRARWSSRPLAQD
ncbi:hypothetical protein AJ79_10106 [Helicocarpus griseus UAMH5409]|uniref:F-box domain-containing protein n=1 Tax=Helicocarpus griseus UAMH5409 TaxID=1447875 RepID=A0A2B7WFQ8_9EURO|nr:hypothetical protein AJ79_10106 [Helicocarpus griseus UAMH5409]